MAHLDTVLALWASCDVPEATISGEYVTPRERCERSPLEPAPDDRPPPDPAAWRRVLPTWPVERREAWGRRANEQAESGVRWPDDERIAFEEMTA
jgi:hypothetical protein